MPIISGEVGYFSGQIPSSCLFFLRGILKEFYWNLVWLCWQIIFLSAKQKQMTTEFKNYQSYSSQIRAPCFQLRTSKRCTVLLHLHYQFWGKHWLPLSCKALIGSVKKIIWQNGDLVGCTWRPVHLNIDQ